MAVVYFPPVAFPPKPARYLVGGGGELPLLSPSISGNSYIGPSNVSSTKHSSCGMLPRVVEDGYGSMEYGDGFEFQAYEGSCGDEPGFVGEIVKVSEHNYQAFKSRTWGASTLITNNLQDARMFINSACGCSCREQIEPRVDGTVVYQFYNDSFPGVVQGEDYGYGS